MRDGAALGESAGCQNACMQDGRAASRQCARQGCPMQQLCQRRQRGLFVPVYRCMLKTTRDREERRERREMGRRGSGEGERRWDADDARLPRRRDVLQPCVGGATPACVSALESGDFTKIKLQM